MVELYSRIGGQGYTLLYLTNRAIGQSDMTREYINSISENQYKMPEGPICKSLSTEYCNIVYLDWIFPPNIIIISPFQCCKLILSLELFKQRSGGGPLFCGLSQWFVLFQVITGQPEVNKIALLSRIRGLFQTNPFVAGFGNKVENTYVFIDIDIDFYSI